MSPSPPPTRRELNWVLLWAAFVMALTCLPYAYALNIADGRTFGGFLWGVDEGNVYLTWMRQAAEGRLLFSNQYSLAPEQPHFLNLLLQAAGRIGGLTGLPPVVMFHALRVVGGLLLLYCFYLLVAEVTGSRLARWAALGLASLGSGLGWAVVLADGLGGLRPIDVGTQWQIQPEAVTFPSLLLNGLFTVSMAVMCLVFRYALRALRDGDSRAAVGAGCWLLLLGNIHTYDVFPVHLTLGLLVGAGAAVGMLDLRRSLRSYGIMFAIGLPSVLWALYAAHADPAFMAKGLTPTPAFRLVDYAAGYGLVGLLALIGAWPAWRQRSPAAWLPICWAIGGSLVLFIPVSFQRKMIEGLHLPLCMLAGIAVASLAARLTRGSVARGKLGEARERSVLTLIAAIVLTLPSNALFVADCLTHVRNNNSDLARVLQPPLYLDAGDAAAMGWLATGAEANDVILSSSFTGSYLPAYCRARPWVGHWAETLALTRDGYYLPPSAPVATWAEVGRNQRVAQVGFRANLGLPDMVYRLRTGADILHVLREHPVTMVYYGPWERALTAAHGWDLGAWQREAAAVLVKVYDAGGVSVYRVPPPEGVPVAAAD